MGNTFTTISQSKNTNKMNKEYEHKVKNLIVDPVTLEEKYEEETMVKLKVFTDKIVKDIQKIKKIEGGLFDSLMVIDNLLDKPIDTNQCSSKVQDLRSLIYDNVQRFDIGEDVLVYSKFYTSLYLFFSRDDIQNHLITTDIYDQYKSEI